MIARAVLLALFALITGCTTMTEQEKVADYAASALWAVRETGSAKRADVFYIHPTTFRSQQWNQELADQETTARTNLVARDRQLTAFAACCARYMPYYRQASSRAFVERNGTGANAYDFAYRDIRRAFRHYIAQDNGGRPFILAGHSQGALLGLRLLREEIAGTNAERLMVAAYLPGLGIPAGSLPTAFPPCSKPRSTGCVISWNSFEVGTDTSEYIARSAREYGIPGRDQSLVCINPVSFDAARPDTGLDDAAGAMPGPPVSGPLPLRIGGHVAARCANGVLTVTVKDGMPVERLPGGSLHLADIALFWNDISANAVGRVAAWETVQ